MTEYEEFRNFSFDGEFAIFTLLNGPKKPADKVRSSWFHDEQMQDSVTTIQLDSMTHPSVFAANWNNRATKEKLFPISSGLVTINSHISDTFAVGLNLPKNISIVTFLHS